MSNFAKIWHTCSFGEYPGALFSFFKNFDFGAWGRVFRQNEALTFGQAGDLKYGQIWLKFCTHVFLGECLGVFFSFFKKKLIFGAWGRVFRQNEARTFGRPEDLKWSDLAEIWDTSFFGVCLRDIFSFFKRFNIRDLGQVFQNCYNWTSK